MNLRYRLTFHHTRFPTLNRSVTSHFEYDQNDLEFVATVPSSENAATVQPGLILFTSSIYPHDTGIVPVLHADRPRFGLSPPCGHPSAWNRKEASLE